MVRKANLIMPEAVTCMALRTHLSEEDFSILADCMGHSLATMRNYYRVPQDILLLAKCSTVFLAADQGVKHYKGRKLHKVELPEEEEVVPLPEDEAQDNEEVSCEETMLKGR